MRSQELIAKLALTKHPEGGFFKEIYRSEEIIPQNELSANFSGDRNLSTLIYFLLEKNNFSAFHKIKSDEIWHHYEGCAVILHTISNNGIHKKHLLGKELENGELPVIIIKKNTFFAAELIDKSSYALAGCSVSPGFNFEDFEMPKQVEMIKKFPIHKDLFLKLSIK